MMQRSTWVALIMVVVFVVCIVPAVWLGVINGFFDGDVVGQAALLLAFAGFMVVGAVIVTRRPGNAIGWVFSAIGLLVGTGMLAWQYAVYVHATGRGPSSAVIVGAWYTGWWWYATASLTFVFTLLLFPHRPAAVAPLAPGRPGGGVRHRDDGNRSSDRRSAR
jgi:hypothetical protein